MLEVKEKIPFSSLSKLDKKDILTEIMKKPLVLNEKLGLNKRTTFGIEIEFVASDINFYNLFGNYAWICDLTDQVKNISYYGYRWQITDELCLDYSNQEVSGYEIISSILSDDVSDFNKIEMVCRKLKRYGAIINDRCGGHIHFGVDQYFKTKVNKVKNFLKFYALYEDVLTKFSCGEFVNIRGCAPVFAAPIRYDIIKLLDATNGKENIDEFLKSIELSTMSSMNIDNYIDWYLDDYPSATVEFRIPNGSLNPVIWKNNINVFGHFLEYAVSDDFDSEFIDYKLKSLKSSLPHHGKQLLKIYNVSNIDKALELADLIFDNTLDKHNFLRQYIKDGNEVSSKQLVKSHPFW